MSDLEKKNLANYDIVGIGSLSSKIKEAYIKSLKQVQPPLVTQLAPAPHKA